MPRSIPPCLPVSLPFAGIVAMLIGCSTTTVVPTPTPAGAPGVGDTTAANPTLDDLSIPVTAAENRPVSFTNKRSAYFYTQTHRNDHPEHAWFRGLNIAGRRIFNDYRLVVRGVALDPARMAPTNSGCRARKASMARGPKRAPPGLDPDPLLLPRHSRSWDGAAASGT